MRGCERKTRLFSAKASGYNDPKSVKCASENWQYQDWLEADQSRLDNQKRPKKTDGNSGNAPWADALTQKHARKNANKNWCGKKTRGCFTQCYKRQRRIKKCIGQRHTDRTNDRPEPSLWLYLMHAPAGECPKTQNGNHDQ